MNSFGYVRTFGAWLGLALVSVLSAYSARGEIVAFNMRDVAIFTSTAPTTITATTGQPIPGGIAGGSQFNLSSLQFDIDGDLDINEPDPTIFFDFQIRTATAVGGQLVFDGFHHTFIESVPETGSYVVTHDNGQVGEHYLNFPFVSGELIGDGIEEYARDGRDVVPPNFNLTFSVALDEGGNVTYFTEGVDNFVGFQLDSGNYGWIRVLYDATDSGTLTFLDGAYDDTGAPIAAGDSGSPVVSDADFDGNGSVDGRDFLIWQRGFGLDEQLDNSNGDANGDTVVDGLDLTDWQNQYGPGGLSALTTAQVPEPASALLMACFCIAAFCRPR